MNKYKRFKITYTLIAVSIVVYIMTTLLFGLDMSSYDALMFMGYNPVYVSTYHAYYRLITANFIHFGIFHLVVNCYSLYNVGTFIERILDFKDYLIVVISSMISTTLIPYILYLIMGFGYNSVSGGISGVICGLIGSIIAFALVIKGAFQDVLRGIMPSILLMIVLSVVSSSISLSGHLSGMLGGFVSTYMILKNKTRHRIIN